MKLFQCLDFQHSWKNVLLVLAALVFFLDGNNGSSLPGEPLNPDDFQRAKIYAQTLKTVQGHQNDSVNLKPSQERLERVIGRDLPLKWKNGRVHYEISNEFTVDERTIITSAAMEFSSRTEGCINFVSRVPLVHQMERDFVNITKGGQYCTSYMGRRGRGQKLNFAPHCIVRGTVIHEMMHVLGLDHEHQRSDRDQYIDIKYENILTELLPQFENFNDTWNERTSDYDYASILHYSDDAECNQNPCTVKTIVIKDNSSSSSVVLGQRNGLSVLDLKKLEKLYRCKDRKPMDIVNNVMPSANQVFETTDGKKIQTDQNKKCRDFDARCKSVSPADCGKNKTWINFNCREKCGACEPSCRDYNVKCQEWSLAGGCKEYAEYMLVYCRGSCGVCSTK